MQQDALTALMQLGTIGEHHSAFGALMPALPLEDLCIRPAVEVQHAVARLLFLLSRSAVLERPDTAASLASGLAGGGPGLCTLSELSGRPLALLLRSDSALVQGTAARAVLRLAEHGQTSRVSLIQGEVVPPLVEAMRTDDVPERGRFTAPPSCFTTLPPHRRHRPPTPPHTSSPHTHIPSPPHTPHLLSVCFGPVMESLESSLPIMES